MAKKAAGRKKNNYNEILRAMDLMMSSNHSSVIGRDFILSRKTNPKYGFIDPDDLPDPDQEFIDYIVNLKAINKAEVPKNLELLSNQYTEKRKIIEKFDHANYDNAMASGIEAAKELGNYNEFDDKIVLYNDSEMNMFFDYIALYRELDGKRSMINWYLKNPDLINETNKELVAAYEQARFAVLRLDKNLDHGAIKVTEIISQKQYILIDKALNRSKKEGMFFVCSILDMQDYIMTSGGGIPLDPKSPGGKSLLSLLKMHLDKIRNSKEIINADICECVRVIYGTAIRAGALQGMTIG